ncbi:MAG: metal-dependent hydrolase [Thermodesulfobacteriota bacterium]|nr:metal-dependent hydrolase [Thermodesulfobacteriota bacterium]
MDSVTQIALGAAVGEATLGRQVGKRALVWGAFCGLLPDLDVLYPFSDPVKAFTYHRGPSHSLFVLVALTPLLVWLIRKRHPVTAEYRNRWYALVFLAFATHVLLDCFTVYGTQILWPFATPPVMWSTIFIIDPLFSAPLFFGVLAALVATRKRSWGHLANTVCLVVSASYLLWTVGAKAYVTDMARASLGRQEVTYERMLTIPSPFNTLLWRVLAMDDKGYYEGFYSLFDLSRDIEMTHYPSDSDLLEGVADHWSVKRLKWFTHGFYAVLPSLDDIVIMDLRMGMEPFYVFQFKVGDIGNPHGKVTRERQAMGEQGWEQLRWVWKRIWKEEATIPSTSKDS